MINLGIFILYIRLNILATSWVCVKLSTRHHFVTFG